MNDVEKKNIRFLSEENTPYIREFTLLSDSEIADLVERRLYSNNYFSYTIYSIHKSKGIIVLIRDACGHKVETTLVEIEDGLILEECIECRQIEKDKLISFINKVQDELEERELMAVLFETDENTDSVYIVCNKCGRRYYLNTDFDLDDQASDMYCKNWDCMIETLVLEEHWLGDDIKSGKIVIKQNRYSTDNAPFIKDDEDWVHDLRKFEGSCELRCEKCGAVNILPFGKWECQACSYATEDDYTITKWDEIADDVTVNCRKCGIQYHITCDDAIEEVYECYNCYKQNMGSKYTCQYVI